MTVLAVALAGALGAPARYLVERAMRLRGGDRLGSAFPWGTFVVNITGSFALGALTGLVLYHALDTDARTIIGTGFLGAYTTFSTFAYESVRLAEDPATRGVAARYLAASTVVGVAAAALGLALASI